MRRLPSLESLRVFEAAARLQSFKEAAEELRVTASAVSHRVGALEDELGAPLFVRHTRRIELTPDGARLEAAMRRALTEIRRAVAAIDRRESLRLRITAVPSQVTRWLAPRLHRFHLAHPDVEIHVVADLALVDLGQRAFDVALRFGAGAYPGVHVERVMGDAVVLVASPRYMAEHGPITGPADVLRLARIIDDTSEHDQSGVNWRTWFEHHGLPAETLAKGLHFNGAIITLEAAAGGLGVAIARKSLIQDELGRGRLEKVLPGELPAHWSHYALTPPELIDWPPVRAFIDWLHREAGQFSSG